ncbi:cytochrome c [Planctomicrobium sp. SH661]|uniref:c-type cytochrome n=1 Tax=Planctomicrobium sp. SH661 TaxID=3448124 RepID=UPI003F5C8516
MLERNLMEVKMGIAGGRFAMLCLFSAAFCGFCSSGHAEDVPAGYRFLIEKPYLPPDFDEDSFSNIWKVWPEPLRTQAEQATPVERRKLAFSRYGLTPRPGTDLSTTTDEHFPPLQYVVNESSEWTMNCFSCHGGQVLGQTYPGAPNNRFMLHLLSEEMRLMKEKYYPERPRGRMERATQVFPLGDTRGTTNAVMFGVILMSMRDPDLNLRTPTSLPRLVHHDMDTPPWWNYKKKSHIYADAYAPRDHRSLMQFMLVRNNGPEKFREWEDDFKQVAAYLESIEPPKYPFPINQELASRGEVAFNKNCAECHGTYGKDGTFPNRIVSVDEVGTDPVRFKSVMPSDREYFGQTWFGYYGTLDTISETDGYLAPPLDGIWASAPYFHNGSVPTLWHVLHPDKRPVVWTRTSESGLDQERIGLEVEELPKIPRTVRDTREMREYFNTRQTGKSAAGHTFPDALSEEEKQAVLEYLKTL